MTNLYHCIENEKVGIFESPTGTGKSLSLICASLTWLRDHKRQAVENAVNSIESGGDPEWIVEAERNARREELLYQRRELEQKLLAARKKDMTKPGRSGIVARSVKKPVSDQYPSYFYLLIVVQRGNDCNTHESEKADDAFVLDDYASGEEEEAEKKKTQCGRMGWCMSIWTWIDVHLAAYAYAKSRPKKPHLADHSLVDYCLVPMFLCCTTQPFCIYLTVSTATCSRATSFAASTCQYTILNESPCLRRAVFFLPHNLVLPVRRSPPCSSRRGRAFGRHILGWLWGGKVSGTRTRRLPLGVKIQANEAWVG